MEEIWIGIICKIINGIIGVDRIGIVCIGIIWVVDIGNVRVCVIANIWIGGIIISKGIITVRVIAETIIAIRIDHVRPSLMDNIAITIQDAILDSIAWNMLAPTIPMSCSLAPLLILRVLSHDIKFLLLRMLHLLPY